MHIRGLVDEDFVNYKIPSLFIITPSCNFKCCIEAGNTICQNMSVAKQPIIEIDTDILIARYLGNPITKAIVFGGLEPFESFDELYEFIYFLRNGYHCEDDVVIYTGFYPEEISHELERLSKFSNIIVKFGRFIPDQTPHFDEVLGISLASSNQWAERL